MIGRMKTLPILGLAMLLTAAGAAEDAKKGAPAPDNAVLAGTHAWRTWIVLRTPFVKGADGALAPIYKADKGQKKPLAVVTGDLPPAGWSAADFDDTDWLRSAAVGLEKDGGEQALVCLRKAFLVADPAAAKDVTLSLRFTGGVAIYLNGKELLRTNLPSGEITAETVADPLPESAYVDAEGKLLADDPKAPVADRTRIVADLPIPAASLQKGRNVLGLAFVRAPVREVALTAEARGKRPPLWPHLKIDEIRLQAPAASGVTAPRKQPAGVFVSNFGMLEPMLTVCSGADPAEPLRPVRLSAPRNGVASGIVLVSSDQPITGLAVKVGELKPKGRLESVPAATLRIRYAVPDLPRYWYNSPPPIFDSLLDSPPDPVGIPDKRGQAVQPVWITAQTFSNAVPGEYEGSVIVKAAGLPETVVPVQLTVHGFTLPDPLRYTAHVGLIESPESVALKYKLELWSPRHWEMIDQLFALMAQVGNKTVYLPAIRHTNLGNDQSMIRYVKAADGKLACDFTLLEKYVDIAAKHLKPDVTCLYLYDIYMGSGYFGQASKEAIQPPRLTLVDPATGQLAEGEGPNWTNQVEAVAFWKMVVDGTRACLQKRGLAGSLMMGMNGDSRPKPVHEKVLVEAAPGVKWVNQAHPFLTEMLTPKLIPAGYVTTVWNSGQPPDPREQHLYGWRPVEYRGDKFLGATFPREGGGCIGKMCDSSAPGVFRLINEAALTSGRAGFGRTGADFWRVIEGRYGELDKRSISARQTSWAQCDIGNGTLALLGAGPNGPVATRRFELVREGVQAGEARIFLERALTDATQKARLGEELAARCQALLDRRVDGMRRAFGNADNPRLLAVASTLPASDRALYALAAEAEGKLAK
jgi:hypothetical protein